MSAAEVVSRFTILESQPSLRLQPSQLPGKAQTFQCDTCHLLYAAAVARHLDFACCFDCPGILLPVVSDQEFAQ